MSDPQETRYGGDTTSDEIARSLGSVWQRFGGRRPKSASVEIEKNRITCVIEEGAPDPASADGEGGSPSDSASFNYNATAVITRATGRRVIAFIPKSDKKTQTSTQTFILDQPRQRF
jgi:hypothetical protein